MALPEVTYQDYQAWGGTLEEGAFSASLRAAVGRVRHVIGFNVPENDDEAAAYANAVCAAVDVDAAYGASGGVGEGAQSLSIGSFSVGSGVSYANAGGFMSEYDQDMLRAIRAELIGTSLLYQGVG